MLKVDGYVRPNSHFEKLLETRGSLLVLLVLFLFLLLLVLLLLHQSDCVVDREGYQRLPNTVLIIRDFCSPDMRARTVTHLSSLCRSLYPFFHAG